MIRITNTRREKPITNGILADNCVHTVRNALAAANFWSPISVLEIKIRHLLNPAVPANEFANLALPAPKGRSDYEQLQGEGSSETRSTNSMASDAARRAAEDAASARA